MAVPGFSVTELVQAVGHIKTVYDGFFDKYNNSATLVRDLADHITQFQTNLEAHKGVIQSRGLDYSGYDAIKRTLGECEEFLNKYKAVLDKKTSWEKMWRTGKFKYEQDTVARLQKQIESHAINILHFNMNVLLQDRFHRGDMVDTNVVTQALDIPSGPSQDVGILPPPAIPSKTPRHLEESRLSISPKHAPSRSLTELQTSGSVSGQESMEGSPTTQPLVPATPQASLGLQNQSSDAVLQPPLDYCVAKLYIGKIEAENVTELRRKPRGRDIPKARELLIFDEKGKARLRHQIKIRPRQPCYPYTWHSMWDRDLEVTFKGPRPEAHNVKFYERPAGPGIPSYVFTKDDDYKEFQSQVRGEKLIDYFDVTKIRSNSSTTEATDQHLKIWKNPITQDHSISFYASVAKDPLDLEFPVSWFAREIKSQGDEMVTLTFLIVEETKARFWNRDSRSSIGKSLSSASISTSTASIFSQKPMPKKQMTMTTVADSAMSAISSGSGNSETPTDDSKSGLSLLEARAMKMKNINIEFSYDGEADRFEDLFTKIYKEEASRPMEIFHDWQMGVGPSQRAGSVASNMSSPPTPFTMSPELRGQPSPVLRPQR